MAADQRKNRVKGSSLVAWESRDKYRVKRKRLEPPQPELEMRPYISLEWDKKKKSVVSQREQIGISWSQLLPLIEASPCRHKMLADVFSVPEEIFDLENLSEVLSYEVWQSHLSENERSSLSQFLPKDAEPDTIVQDLLAGNNYHFGNTFLRWGASVCSGELHPDNVLHKQQSLKVCRKDYHSALQKYHYNMIVNLQTWKDKWASCNDPEVDILQNSRRSRECVGKTFNARKAHFVDTEENLVTTPDSCSWANSEKASSSDNQKLGLVHGGSQRRKDHLNKVSDSSSSGMKVAALPRKGERPHKSDITHSNGAKYMTYIKVSKELHGRVKSSMKHGGDSLKPRSLNNLMGGVGTLNAQPFEKFEEEERKKLHDYWLKLANKDISEGFATWRNRKLLRQQVLWSMGVEVEQKAAIKDKDEVCSKDDAMELSNDTAEGIPCTILVEVAEKVQHDDLLQEQMDSEEHEKAKTNDIFEEQTYIGTKMIEEEEQQEQQEERQEQEQEGVEEEVLSANVLFHDHSQPQIVSLTNNPQINSAEIHDHNQQQKALLTGNPQIKSAEIQSHGNNASAVEDGNLNQVDIYVGHGAPLPSACDVWPVHGSVYHSTAGNVGYAPVQDLLVAHPQFIQEQPLQMLDCEANGLNKDSGKDILHRDCDGTPFLDSDTNEDRNEYLQSLLKGRGSSPYYQEPRNSGIHPRYNPMMEIGQFSRQLAQPVHPLLPVDLRQNIPNNIYMHQNNQDSMYSDGPRYTMPRQQQLPVDIHNWAVPNVVRMSALSQPHLNSGELTRKPYTSENGAQVGWPTTFQSSAVGMNHSLSNGSDSDQTLFSVLSECNQIQPVTSYDSMGSTQRFIQSGNYSGVSEGIPSSSSGLHTSPNPLNYLSGYEPKINNNSSIGGMGFPQQNSGLQESVGKPFLRSWNQ